MKAGEKNYLKESNGTKANCNANVTQVRKSRIYNESNYCSNKHYLSSGENKAPKKIQALFKMRVIIAVMNTT